MNDIVEAKTLTRAIRSLTVAVWCLCALMLALIGFYAWSYVRSVRWMRGARSENTATSKALPSRAPSAEVDQGKPFHELPPEEMVKQSSAILLTKFQKDGERLEAVVIEILKQRAGADLYYKVGDEYADLSRWPRENESYGDGDVVFLVGSPSVMSSAFSYRGDRIGGLGDMPLTRLREMIDRQSGKSVPAPEPSPRGARVGNPVSDKQEGKLIDLERSTNASGVTRVFSISQRAARNIPEWRPENGDPPFPITQAIRSGVEAVRAQSEQHEVFVARSIGLRLVSCGDEALGEPLVLRLRLRSPGRWLARDGPQRSDRRSDGRQCGGWEDSALRSLGRDIETRRENK